MEKNSDGAHCRNCNKTVIDFSNLSDQSLYEYFNKYGANTCGRFHNDQVNRPLFPPKPSRTFPSRLYRMTAALFAFLSLKYVQATPARQNTSVTIHPETKSEISLNSIDKLTITGIVKDAGNKPLKDVEVRFGDTVVKTDGSGSFSFEFADQFEAKSNFLLFTYPGLVSVVRNYHAAMLSTHYDVIMHEPYKTTRYMMGVPTLESLGFPVVTIDCNKTHPETPDLKARLAAFGHGLRNYPQVKAILTFYPKSEKKVSLKDTPLNSVRSWFVNMEGINQGRFKLVISKYTAEKKNTVEIKVQSENEECDKD